MSDYVPRLSISITEDQSKRLNKCFQEYGMKKMVFNTIIEDLLELCDKHGTGKVFGALAERLIGIREICQLKELEK